MNRIVLAVLLSAGLMFGPTAVAEASVTQSFHVDRVTCGLLLAAQHRQGPADACVGQVTLHPFANVVASVSAASGCRGYWQQFVLRNLITGTIAIDNVNVGLCWNGTHVWRYWGPDCRIDGGPLLYGGSTWCGVYNNGGTSVEPGNNFWVSAFPAPTWKRSGYFRYKVNAFGSLLAIWGSCCSG